jgi:hypothetical protein
MALTCRGADRTPARHRVHAEGVASMSEGFKIRIPTEHVAGIIFTEVDFRLQNFGDDDLTDTPDCQHLKAVYDRLNDETMTFPAVIKLSSAEYEQAKISIENIIECVEDDEAAVLRRCLIAEVRA